MNISKNSVVSIHYTLRDDQNEVLDTSSGAEPLVYLHGSGGLIPGLESALEGRAQGEQLKVTIAPEDAYGLRDDRMIQSIPKSEFKTIDKVKVGMQFQVNSEGGPLVLTVIEIKDSEVVVDGNHPLAGQTLHFDVQITDVRKATDEELEHGHVHGHGGHHH